jgi:acyl carrier protein
MQLDSLQLIALVVEVENRFRVCLEPEDEARIATIGDLVEVIRRRLPEDPHG